jgi:hypothetical protein
MRTTIDIDDPILHELKEIKKTQQKSLGRLVSDLLAQALRERKVIRKGSKPAPWIAKGMGARVNLNDKEALYSTLDDRTAGGKGVAGL